MTTTAIRKLIEMFGGVPLAFYTKHGQDAEAYETWKAAKAEVEAIDAALSSLPAESVAECREEEETWQAARR